MFHDILHDMSKIKEVRFCWDICVSTETHSKVLKIVESLDSDLHEATNQVI